MVTYTSLHTLPIFNYVNCIGGKYKYMIKQDVDAIEEPTDEENKRLKLLFDDICNQYEGKKDVIKTRIIEQINDIDMMRLLNQFVPLMTLADEDNKRELTTQLRRFGMKMRYNQNDSHIKRLIEKVNKQVAAQKTDNTFELNDLASSLITINSTLNLNLTNSSPTSWYFEASDQIRQKIDRERANNL